MTQGNLFTRYYSNEVLVRLICGSLRSLLAIGVSTDFLAVFVRSLTDMRDFDAFTDSLLLLVSLVSNRPTMPFRTLKLEHCSSCCIRG